MPQSELWDKLPEGVRQLNQLSLWVETRPQAPEDDWYKDFGSFKICGKRIVP